MKKILMLIMVMAMLVCAFSISAFADDLVESVIYVNGAPFDGTFEQAMNANKAGTLNKIELKGDVTVSSDWASQATTDRDVEVDLGGNTITFEVSGVFRRGTYTFKNGTIKCVVDNKYPLSLEGSGQVVREVTLNLEDVTVENTTYARCLQIGDGTKTAHTVNLTDVVFSGVHDNFRMFYIANTDEDNVINIYSGTFTGKVTSFSKATVNVYSGTFSDSDISKYLLDGYSASKNDNGTYTVKKLPVNVNGILNTNYSDVSGNYTYRFFAVIDNNELYAKAGFEVTATYEGNEYTWNITLNEVYKTVNVNNTDYTSDDYILTGAVGDVPANDVEFTVKAFAVDFQGDKTYLNWQRRK